MSRTVQNYTNSSTASESENKINVQNNFLKFCLCQQLFVKKSFCMKMRLFNIFKTANSMMLIKLIFESPLHSSPNTIKISILKLLVHFSHLLQFLATVNV